MAKRVCSRRELLDRWIGIQEEEDDGDPSPENQLKVRRAKENWFSDCFTLLVNLPNESHIWCGYSDLMGSLLETFHNYLNDKSSDSPLKLIWKRISSELGRCTQCIFQHHHAQVSYKLEYEPDAVGPLLSMLLRLDEDRVTEHMKKINAKIKHGEYDADSYSVEVVSIMFEVLSYPTLLEDQCLANEFQVLLEAVDNYHEVTLAGSQQYVGVYALLFLRSGRARAIGFRLAGCMGKLRIAADLDPLQPLLKKYIAFLGTEYHPSILDDSRPRVKLDRTTVWIGFKTLLGFLDAPAYEEGILEKYPVFLSIVLNHVSGDTLDFSYAVTCLKISFEILGSKLWLRTALSPSVMRNTLLGQCFHTRNEKSHKEIFDLFLPFLQSLESHQDGEHEKQRRNLLYFLLYQVSHSSNFSELMKKSACKIALLIVHRGYKMVPPCPPFECAHMWGPALVNSLKNLSLHSSLRQPAFDLITTIIISDASALITLQQKKRLVSKNKLTSNAYFFDEEDEPNFFEDIEEKDNSCWIEFSVQSKLASSEWTCWSCIPMLWIASFVELDPTTLPISFSKALFWALSHISVLEANFSVDMSLFVKDWLSIHASEISSSFGWQIPTGFDDGGEGKESRNSIRASSCMCIPLLRTLKRLAAEFILKLENLDLQKQWTWEPRMAESLILSLVDPDDIVRNAGKIILEHLSSNRFLTSGLHFLCSSASSLFAMFLGLKFMFKQVDDCPMMDNFYNLHHVFFVAGKLLKEMVSSPMKASLNPQEYSSSRAFSSQGGFLWQPSVDHLKHSPFECHPNHVDIKSWEKFSCFLSAIMWYPLLKCLAEGKELINNPKCQMTCVRLLETLPAVYEKLSLSKSSGSKLHAVPSSSNFNWLSDLVDWGRSHLVVVIRHWKQCMQSLLNIFKDSQSDITSDMISVIEKSISTDRVMVDSLQEQMRQLLSSLSHSATISKEGQIIMPKSLVYKPRSWKNMADLDESLYFDSCLSSSAVKMNKKHKEEAEVVVLSDDESENVASREVIASCGTNSCTTSFPTSAKAGLSDGHTKSRIASSNCDMLIPFPSGTFTEDNQRSLQEDNNDICYKPCSSSVASRNEGSCMQGTVQSEGIDATLKIGCSVNSAQASIVRPQNCHSSDVLSGKIIKTHLDSKTEVSVIKKLVQDDIDDPLELALDHSDSKPVVSKPPVLASKRKVIQLQMPLNNISLNRTDISSRRLRPPKLDAWYRSILEMDYFMVVGLFSTDRDEKTTSNLREVPLYFQSSDHYVKVFQPLVLEEFKAQLQSSFLESSVEHKHCGSLFVVSVERIDDFHIIRGRSDEKASSTSQGCMENDLVLLTKEPLENSIQSTHVLGKVERREKSDKNYSIILVIRLYLPDSTLRLNKVKRVLIERSKWFLNKVMSMTPQIREFQALSSINVIPMLPIILNPVGNSHGYTEPQRVDLSKLSDSMQEMFKSSFNSSQLQAISVAIQAQASRKFELSLIQGPPGTGKTRTIIAIISVIFASQRVPKSHSSNSMTENTREVNSLSNRRSHLTHSSVVARAWQDAALAKQLMGAEKESFLSTESSLKGRVLVCAQSNAAVDELVSRISEGLYGIDGKRYKPYVVRVGNAKTVHPNSLPFFIDTLVDVRLAEETAISRNSDGGIASKLETSNSLRAKLEKLAERIQYYESKRVKTKDEDANSKVYPGDDNFKEVGIHEMSDAEMEAKLNILYREKKIIYQDLTYAQSREKKAFEESRALKHNIRKTILKEAEIVVTTLSGCGGDLYGVCYESTSSSGSGRFTDQCFFDVVIIDEAAQALEPATLIPLQLLKPNGVKCVMVGDPKQLPATVLSSVASKYLYECSMFERLQRAGHPVIMLTEQYRMHPEICSFPSLHFYNNKLLNGVGVASKSAQFHKHACFGPYIFFDISDGREHNGNSSGSLSLYNDSEANAAISIMKFLRKRYSSDFTSRKIGIITPYKSQLHLLQSQFLKEFGSSTVFDMEFNTVDGFQGREVDIIVLTTVRASISGANSEWSRSNGIGFVADIRRMNVALTRAKLSLWIVGNARTLQTNFHWAALVQNAKERNLFVSVSKPYDSFFENNESFSLGSASSSRLDFCPSHAKKIDMNTSSCETHPDNRNDRDARRRKDQIGGKEALHLAAKASNSASSVGHESSSKDKNKKFTATVGVEGRERKGMKPRIQKDTSESSGKTLQKNSKASEGGTKFIRENVMKDKLVSKVSGHATPSKLSEKSVNLPSSVKFEQGNKTMSKTSGNRNTQNDLLAARKRQRDDIEALLPSALISSKKTGISSHADKIKKPPTRGN